MLKFAASLLIVVLIVQGCFEAGYGAVAATGMGLRRHFMRPLSSFRSLGHNHGKAWMSSASMNTLKHREGKRHIGVAVPNIMSDFIRPEHQVRRFKRPKHSKPNSLNLVQAPTPFPTSSPLNHIVMASHALNQRQQQRHFTSAEALTRNARPNQVCRVIIYRRGIYILCS